MPRLSNSWLLKIIILLFASYNNADCYRVIVVVIKITRWQYQQPSCIKENRKVLHSSGTPQHDSTDTRTTTNIGWKKNCGRTTRINGSDEDDIVETLVE